MKTLLKVVVVLLVLIIGVVVAGFMYIDTLARKGIEVASTSALGVNTTLSKADVGVFAGTFDMAGLNVANPSGFQSPHFLALGQGDIKVSLATLRSDLVELPYLNLSDIDVNLERRDNKSNYQVILDNVKTSESGGSPAPSSGGAEKKFVINEVTVRNINVHIDLLPIGGALTRTDLKISEIKLANIGSGTDKGVVLKELVPTLLKAILAAVVQKGGDIIPADILGELQGSLAQLKSLESLGVNMTGDLQKAVGDVAKQAEDVTKGVQGAADKAKKTVDEVGKGLKDLIPK